MTTQIGASVFVDPSEIRHSVENGHSVLTFGPYPTVRRVDLFFEGSAGIDAVIAELVALRAEMEPPAITDSGRTCGQANPGTGAWCHRDGDHGEHRDTDGETWRTDGSEVAEHPQGNPYPDGTPWCAPCGTHHQPASVTA